MSTFSVEMLGSYEDAAFVSWMFVRSGKLSAIVLSIAPSLSTSCRDTTHSMSTYSLSLCFGFRLIWPATPFNENKRLHVI